MMTQQTIHKSCKRFNVGDRINILRKVNQSNNNPGKPKKIPAIVIARYPFHLVVKNKAGLTESFTYINIVINKELVKTKGGA